MRSYVAERPRCSNDPYGRCGKRCSRSGRRCTPTWRSRLRASRRSLAWTARSVGFAYMAMLRPSDSKHGLSFQQAGFDCSQVHPGRPGQAHPLQDQCSGSIVRHLGLLTIPRPLISLPWPFSKVAAPPANQANLPRVVLSHFNNVLHFIKSLPSVPAAGEGDEAQSLLETAISESTKLLPWVMNGKKQVKAYLKVRGLLYGVRPGCALIGLGISGSAGAVVVCG